MSLVCMMRRAERGADVDIDVVPPQRMKGEAAVVCGAARVGQLNNRVAAASVMTSEVTTPPTPIRSPTKLTIKYPARSTPQHPLVISVPTARRMACYRQELREWVGCRMSRLCIGIL